ncbi:hypothetical protein [Deinococcus radiodurans]|jgi:hypothetical protein|uniref:Uncharacterized protein n=1 Tax=Deinococcus radiodurans (strain ATCC 13939 / DSM 20539 / JCM 16871 / CCUG 27074 / LMG 4051 / NBRC 15346 / NCIMB 9279 / VKM B-1422 / R1) TaxID=243230 RepID=Q9RY82_DEIRA|nr:hypothetical protein [Deinococcus radiodurans]AAF09661.1 hypothetical protein DR_0068 [Deinococcus radiodurans R1 = ATCC 13939 = DSM 20539]ANC70294.1 hypothetical protein A2G07_00050 [Deinococcus radiodurans R1 = ATCC 13939 = DSM 20539]QEM72044.1 hypothetical protein DXG80_09955 [Deinococcus radiodurans]QIP28316.1 hypothetical protein HAV23_03230 [Deinococcus radiodurans]QIP30809.1 hypothetical protein HAV35_00285 [Deinococcus radiodurans]
MNFWRWLTTPDPHPGFTRPKLLKLAVRLFLFVLLATVLSSLLNLTPLRPYLNTFWGSLLFVLLLYIPAARFLNIDTFMPRRFQTPPPQPGARAGQPATNTLDKRREKNRYAGVRKSPPRMGGRR